MKTFEFGIDFQKALLRLLMTDEAFCHKAMTYVESGFFTSQSLGWIFTTQKRYYVEYSRRCQELPLREAARKEPKYSMDVEEVIAVGVVIEHEYIKDQLTEFVRRNIFARAHEESQGVYNAGHYTKAYDMMCNAMDSLRRVAFDTPDRSWFFETLADRQKARARRSANPTDGVYPTGLEPVDDSMDGGPKRGETHLVIGDAKVGKTTWLINQGFVNTRVSRVPVLHFNLEGGTTLVEDRYDSCFSQELYTSVKHGDINAAAYRELVDEYKQLRGLLVVRTLNDWNMNILHLEAELQELESEGFKPEVIIVDYVDLLRSRNKAQSETEHQTEAMKDVKRLSNRGYLVHTACQGRRPRDGDEEKENILRAKDIADAYGKIRIADGWGSLNATLTEQQAGTCRYFHEQYRDGRVGKLYRLHNQQDRMRIGTKIEHIPLKVATAAAAPPTSTSKSKKAGKGVASGPTGRP